jgi:hypothetical protein
MLCGFMRGRRWSVRRLKVRFDVQALQIESILILISVTGLLCFYNEKVDIKIDGEWLEKPKSPFS